MNRLTGVFSTFLMATNLVVNFVLLYIMGFLKVLAGLLRIRRLESALTRHMDLIIDSWAGVNRILFRVCRLTEVDVQWHDAEDLSRKGWYMVLSNHQTWTDILLLQTALVGRIPPIKFFTKRQLLWVPFLGAAMWLLGFPYVRRMSRAQIASNPELLELDRQATLAACLGFKHHPTTVLSFLEGTRFSPEKHGQQSSRYTNLLSPKVSGMAYVLTSLKDELHCLIDVTIDYPCGVPTFWEFMKGECKQVDMQIRCREIPDDIANVGVNAIVAIKLTKNIWVNGSSTRAANRVST